MKCCYWILIILIMQKSKVIASPQELQWAMRKNVNTALTTISEVQNKCAGKCDNFFLSSFKSQIANSFHWTPNFNEKLFEDVNWAVENDCFQNTDVDKLVGIFAGKKTNSAEKDPMCLFKRFESIAPEIPGQGKSKPVIKKVASDPKGNVFSPVSFRKRRVFRRPILNTLKVADNLIEKTLKATQNVLGCTLGNRLGLKGFDVGGGKYGSTYQPRPSYRDYSNQYNGIDVGGGKFAPDYQAPCPDKNKLLVENRNKLNDQISKLSVFRDIRVQINRGNHLTYTDHQNYWNHHRIEREEFRSVVNEEPVIDLDQKIEELIRGRTTIENQFTNTTVTGNTFFNDYDKDKLNNEFISNLAKKLQE